MDDVEFQTIRTQVVYQLMRNDIGGLVQAPEAEKGAWLGLTDESAEELRKTLATEAGVSAMFGALLFGSRLPTRMIPLYYHDPDQHGRAETSAVLDERGAIEKLLSFAPVEVVPKFLTEFGTKLVLILGFDPRASALFQELAELGDKRPHQSTARIPHMPTGFWFNPEQARRDPDNAVSARYYRSRAKSHELASLRRMLAKYGVRIMGHNRTLYKYLVAEDLLGENRRLQKELEILLVECPLSKPSVKLD